MIVVSGATGRLGGAVLTELLEHLPASEVGASTTRPEELARFSEAGVRVRRGDFDDPASLGHSFDGADRVLLVSAPRHGEAAIAAHRVAISAARDAGVGRLFYTSHVGADALSPFPPAVTHAATEVMLRDSGIAFTALRNGFYADTPLRLVRSAAESGVLRVPADAPVSWTMHRDLAPGIAALLLDPAIDLPAINLTAGRAMDMAELAEAGRRSLGRVIRHEQISDEDFAAGLAATGAPAIAVTMTLGIFLASRQRHLGIVDPSLTELLDRPTTSLEAAIPEGIDVS
ncbi:MAG: SDR family NAD(P)-dependent oxidoreductase [Herbiconiux sp.]|uniref:NmrA family NAD(P)-binding protein n=1 Tax=Herbiconiux sp. TaxID=1871186 RepID=UPI0011FD4C3E|nr:NAD(P)H-binding protein [Herbiconiux sp.]TAJ49859.1 MAG: SDR family NAD(P)-dependent oxidoreductase [Herbiconiux sp.]